MTTYQTTDNLQNHARLSQFVHSHSQVFQTHGSSYIFPESAHKKQVSYRMHNTHVGQSQVEIDYSIAYVYPRVHKNGQLE